VPYGRTRRLHTRIVASHAGGHGKWNRDREALRHG